MGNARGIVGDAVADADGYYVRAVSQGEGLCHKGRGWGASGPGVRALCVRGYAVRVAHSEGIRTHAQTGSAPVLPKEDTTLLGNNCD